MKSLIIKDLYNISHNSKSLIMMLLFFAVLFIPTQGISAYVVTSGLLCSIMIVTTFAFDETCNWTKYALITPVTRRDLVLGKFAVLSLFCCFGILNGVVIGGIGGYILSFFRDSVSLNPVEFLLSAVTGICISMLQGSTNVLLLYRFGTEKARIMSLLSFILPTGILAGLYKLLLLSNIAGEQPSFGILASLFVLLTVIWVFFMYRLSYNTFLKQEL